ncbi:hypothetical protein GGF42_009561, partial [Coemansia sp. RSA 2424]
MRTREQDSIRKIFTIDVLAKEQRRLFAEDQFIISPAHINSLFEALRPFLTIAKEWGNTQQQHGLLPPPPPAAAVVAAADASSNRAQAPVPNAAAAVQPTPLSNMHPGATTNDPELEDFQRAVKHPLDPGNLRLPPTKKRALTKTDSNSLISAAAAATNTTPMTPAAAVVGQPPHPMQLAQHPMSQQRQQQQHMASSFAPAPMMLPANMSKEQFDRLPQETRAAILQSQQSALIRQNSLGMSPSAAMHFTQQQQQQQQQQAVGDIHSANPLLLAAVQGISAHSAQSSSAEEQRLKILEQDKWNNPLEYLMCVLGKFTKGAE